MSDNEATRKAAYRWCANALRREFGEWGDTEGMLAQLDRMVVAEVERIIQVLEASGATPIDTNGAPKP